MRTASVAAFVITVLIGVLVLGLVRRGPYRSLDLTCRGYGLEVHAGGGQVYVDGWWAYRGNPLVGDSRDQGGTAGDE
jgi:hypothetical protein